MQLNSLNIKEIQKANWKHKIDISDIWSADVPVEEKGKLIAQRLKSKFARYLDYATSGFDEELEDIIERFESITGYDDVSPVQGFDDTMDMFYDWGDLEFDSWPHSKNCWITAK